MIEKEPDNIYMRKNMAAVILLLLFLSVSECQGGTGIKRTTTDISKNADFHIQFDETKLVCKVSRKFVSVALGIGQLNKTDTGLNPDDARLRRILKALSPAYVRVGGSKANFLYFEPRDDERKDDKSEGSASSEEDSESSDELNEAEEETDEASEPNKNDPQPQPQPPGPGQPQPVPVDLPKDEQTRLESRAIVPIPTQEDIHRFESHKYKRFSLDLPKLKKKKNKRPKEGDMPTGEASPKETSEDPSVPPPPPKPKKKKRKRKKEEEELLTKEEKKRRKKEKKKQKIAGYKDFKMSADLFDTVYNLINSTGNTMLFDINAFPRMENSRSWNSSNAELLLSYADRMGYNIDWQLGNEANHYKNYGKKHIQTGEEVGNDYIVFKNLVTAKQPNSKIVGPDPTQPKNGTKYKDWIGGFLKTAGDSIDALGWHQYYVDGKDTDEDEFVSANILDNFVKQNVMMKEMMAENNFTKPTWLTETGSAWGGGAEDLSDRFAGMFSYVDKLGVAGQNCIQVVARQSFLSGKYAMINKTDYSPHPEFFAAALFKRLAANGVLKIQSDKHDKNFRVYARCARSSKHTLPGSVFVTVINLSKQSKTFAFPVYELFKVKQYLFTADSLRSDIVNLNGKPLKMDGDQMPKMRATYVQQPVKVDGLSIGFYILDLVSLNIC